MCLNAAFLRARIQWLDHFFAPREVGEVWLTFSDPQNADKRGTKRLTSPHYLWLYQSLLTDGGVVHVKTDSPEFYENTLRDGPLAEMVVEESCEDVHGAPAGRFDAELTDLLAFKTAYEERWIQEGGRSTTRGSVARSTLTPGSSRGPSACCRGHPARRDPSSISARPVARVSWIDRP